MTDEPTLYHNFYKLQDITGKYVLPVSQFTYLCSNISLSMTSLLQYFSRLVLFVCVVGMIACQPGNHSKSKTNKKQPLVQMIVKLHEGESVDSLLRSFTKYDLQPVQNLSQQDNMWLLSAKAENGYALVEIIRTMEIVEAAELNTAVKPPAQ